MISIWIFFFLGGPGRRADAHPPAHAARPLVGPDTYNRMFTMHGVIMVLFFLVPSIPAAAGQFPACRS